MGVLQYSFGMWIHNQEEMLITNHTLTTSMDSYMPRMGMLQENRIWATAL